MKKRLTIVLTVALLLGQLCACGDTVPTSSVPPEEAPLPTTSETTGTTTESRTTTTTFTTTTQKPTTTTVKTTTTTTTTTRARVVLDIPEEHQPQYTADTDRSANTDFSDLYDNGYIYFYDTLHTKKICRMHLDDRKVTALPIASSKFTVYKDQVYYVENGSIYRYNTKTKATDSFPSSGDVQNLFVTGERIYALSKWPDWPYPFIRCIPLDGKEAFDLNFYGYSLNGTSMNFGGDVVVLGCNRGNFLFLYTLDNGYDMAVCAMDYRASNTRKASFYSDRLYFGTGGLTRYLCPQQELTIRGDHIIQFAHSYGVYVAIDMVSKSGTVLNIPSDHQLTKDYAVYIPEKSGQQETVFVDWNNRKTTVKLPSQYGTPTLREASAVENLVLLDCVNKTTGKPHILAVFSGGTVLDLTDLAGK